MLAVNVQLQLCFYMFFLYSLPFTIRSFASNTSWTHTGTYIKSGYFQILVCSVYGQIVPGSDRSKSDRSRIYIVSWFHLERVKKTFLLDENVKKKCHSRCFLDGTS